MGWGGAADMVPVPLSGTTCVEPKFPESSLTFSAPVTEPAASGVNVTDTVQLDPANRAAGQSFVSEKPSLVEKANPFSGLPPKLVIVTAWELLAVPMSWSAKVKVAGEKLIAEGRGLGTGTGVAPKT